MKGTGSLLRPRRKLGAAGAISIVGRRSRQRVKSLFGLSRCSTLPISPAVFDLTAWIVQSQLMGFIVVIHNVSAVSCNFVISRKSESAKFLFRGHSGAPLCPDTPTASSRVFMSAARLKNSLRTRSIPPVESIDPFSFLSLFLPLLLHFNLLSTIKQILEAMYVFFHPSQIYLQQRLSRRSHF